MANAKLISYEDRQLKMLKNIASVIKIIAQNAIDNFEVMNDSIN